MAKKKKKHKNKKQNRKRHPPTSRSKSNNKKEVKLVKAKHTKAEWRRKGSIDPSMAEHKKIGFVNTRITALRREAQGEAARYFAYDMPVEEKILWAQFTGFASDIEKQSVSTYKTPAKKRKIQALPINAYKQNTGWCINFYLPVPRPASPYFDIGAPLPVLMDVKVEGKIRAEWRIGIHFMVIAQRSEYPVEFLKAVRLAVPYILYFHRKDGRIFRHLRGKMCVVELIPPGRIVNSEELFTDGRPVAAGPEYGKLVHEKSDPKSDIIDCGWLWFDCIPPNDESGRRAIKFDEIAFGHIELQLQGACVRKDVKLKDREFRRGIRVSAGSGMVKITFRSDGGYEIEGLKKPLAP